MQVYFDDGFFVVVMSYLVCLFVFCWFCFYFVFGWLGFFLLVFWFNYLFGLGFLVKNINDINVLNKVKSFSLCVVGCLYMKYCVCEREKKRERKREREKREMK